MLQLSYTSPRIQFICSTSHDIINLLERIHGKARESVSVWELRGFKPLRTQPSHCTGLILALPPTLHLSTLGLHTATASANGSLCVTAPRSKIQAIGVWFADCILYFCPSGQSWGENKSDFSSASELCIFKSDEIKYSTIRLSSRIDTADNELINGEASSNNSLKRYWEVIKR